MARLERLLVSTRNNGKLSELSALLSPLGIGLVSAADVRLPEIDETGETLVDNALIKAAAGYRATGMATLADDTGLCVDALDGAPGVYSARFAGQEATYEDNWRLLLQRLKGVATPDRGAAFVCALALVVDASWVPERHPLRVHRPDLPSGSAMLSVEGKMMGGITTEPAGTGGFGYDPVFFYPPASATLAQLSAQEKNQVSHRAVAYGRLAIALGELVG